jgi:hypothetical protein
MADERAGLDRGAGRGKVVGHHDVVHHRAADHRHRRRPGRLPGTGVAGELRGLLERRGGDAQLGQLLKRPGLQGRP